MIVAVEARTQSRSALYSASQLSLFKELEVGQVQILSSMRGAGVVSSTQPLGRCSKMECIMTQWCILCRRQTIAQTVALNRYDNIANMQKKTMPWLW